MKTFVAFFFPHSSFTTGPTLTQPNMKHFASLSVVSGTAYLPKAGGTLEILSYETDGRAVCSSLVIGICS